MTSPTHARQVSGKGRWYFHPSTGEQWPSVTNVIDLGVSKPALVPWAAKITEIKARDSVPRYVYLSRRKPCAATRVADRCGDCIDCLSRQVRAEVKIAKDMAADLGSRIHAIVEARVTGVTVPDDPEAEPYVEQALAFFDDAGVDIATDVEAAEATIINRTYGYAGTGDLWLRLKVGAQRRQRLLLVDYKTSATRPVDSTYPEYGMQLAALARGEVLLLDDGTEVPAPGPIEGAAVLNLRAKSYALIPFPDLDKAFVGFLGCLATATYLHSQHGIKPQPLDLARAVTSTRKAS